MIVKMTLFHVCLHNCLLQGVRWETSRDCNIFGITKQELVIRKENRQQSHYRLAWTAAESSNSCLFPCRRASQIAMRGIEFRETRPQWTNWSA